MTIRAASLTPVLALLACSAFAQDKPDKRVDPAAHREIPAFVVPPAREGVTYQRFIAFGDMGTGSADQKQVAACMAKRAEAGLDFMITLGDNFYPWGVLSADDPQWKTKWKDVYSAPSLQVPTYPSLGNHDHLAGPQPQIDYSRKDPNWRLPSSYHSFKRPLDNGEAAQFFVLDTQTLLLGERDAKQLEWLEKELASSRARWKIVYGHHPLYSYSKRPHNRRLIEQLEPLFVKHGVDVYLAGHDHVLEMLKPVKGVHYVVSGAAGGPDKSYGVFWNDKAYYAATRGGFVLARLSSDELVLEFVRMDAKTQYAHVLRKGRMGPF